MKTTYCVLFRFHHTGHESIVRCDSAMERALTVISFGRYADILKGMGGAMNLLPPEIKHDALWFLGAAFLVALAAFIVWALTTPF